MLLMITRSKTDLDTGLPLHPQAPLGLLVKFPLLIFTRLWRFIYLAVCIFVCFTVARILLN